MSCPWHRLDGGFARDHTGAVSRAAELAHWTDMRSLALGCDTANRPPAVQRRLPRRTSDAAARRSLVGHR